MHIISHSLHVKNLVKSCITIVLSCVMSDDPLKNGPQRRRPVLHHGLSCAFMADEFMVNPLK